MTFLRNILATIAALFWLAMGLARVALSLARLVALPPRVQVVINDRPSGSLRIGRRAAFAMARSTWSQVIGSLRVSLA